MDGPAARFGTFFILIGFVLLALFAGSVVGKSFNVLYLALGAVSLFLGISIRRRALPPPTSSNNGRIGALILISGLVLLILFAESVIGGEYDAFHPTPTEAVSENNQRDAFGEEYNILYPTPTEAIGENNQHEAIDEGPYFLFLILGAAAIFVGITIIKASRRSRLNSEKEQPKKDQKKR